MKSIVDKELVKYLYIEEGLIPSEIAGRLDLKIDTVKKCIERNLKNYLLQHKRTRYKKKEVEKAINYEAISCMGDSAFIKKNPSIYKTISNGDIIVNVPEETLPWDVPRMLKNDDSKELYEKRVTKKYKKSENELLSN